MNLAVRWPVVVLAAAAGLQAQTESLDLRSAVQKALSGYGGVRASDARVRTASAGVALARTAYLPKLEGVAGMNRATHNNVFGLLLPSQILAPISGPVLDTNSVSSVWGSTVGVIGSWQPFDFGVRAAAVAAARAGEDRASAGASRTRLEIAILTAAAFLNLAAAQQTVVASEAAVARAAELQRITDALVSAELRPGAESSLARAENAGVQAQLIRSRQAVAEAKAALAAFLGVEAASLRIEPGRLLQVPSPADAAAAAQHPAAREQQAAIRESEARLRAVERSYFPSFTIQGTSYARGTGVMADGRSLGGAHGLGPNIQNWAAGITASFPVADLPAIRARRAAEQGRLDAERARYDELLAELRSRAGAAAASLEAAREIAAITPVAVQAAQDAVQQARARYEAGLGTALDVADAQRRLTQAEIDDSLARLNIWRAKLALQAAAGNLDPVLAEAAR